MKCAKDIVAIKAIAENEYLKEVHNWGEIYRYIYELEENNAR